MGASRQNRGIRRLNLLLTLLMAMCIFRALTFESGGQSGILSSIPGFDKIAHFALFALLAGLAVSVLPRQRRSIPGLIGIIAGCAAYGLLMEYVQLYYFPSRTFEWMDALADALGAATSGWIGYYFLK